MIRLFLRDLFTADDATRVAKTLTNLSESFQGDARNWSGHTPDDVTVTVQVLPTASTPELCDEELGWLRLSAETVPECMTITAEKATVDAETFVHQIVLMLSMDLEYESTGVSVQR